METPPDTGTEPAVLADLAAHGERSSAFVTAGPGFETFRGEPGGPRGCVRYQRSAGGRHWLGATEPIAPVDDRVPLALAFFEAARAAGARPLMLPVSAALSAALLTVHGCHRLQVGVEPIFDLFDVFSGPDPLILHPRARALSRKGARLVEFPPAELAEGTPRRAQPGRGARGLAGRPQDAAARFPEPRRPLRAARTAVLRARFALTPERRERRDRRLRRAPCPCPRRAAGISPICCAARGPRPARWSS